MAENAVIIISEDNAGAYVETKHEPVAYTLGTHATLRTFDIETSTLEEMKALLMTLIDDLKARKEI